MLCCSRLATSSKNKLHKHVYKQLFSHLANSRPSTANQNQNKQKTLEKSTKQKLGKYNAEKSENNYMFYITIGTHFPLAYRQYAIVFECDCDS